MGNRTAIVHSDPTKCDNPITEDSPLPVTSIASLVKEKYDSVYATYPTTSTEVYTFKQDSVTVATITVTYTDSTKEIFSSAVRT